MSEKSNATVNVNPEKMTTKTLAVLLVVIFLGIFGGWAISINVATTDAVDVVEVVPVVEVIENADVVTPEVVQRAEVVEAVLDAVKAADVPAAEVTLDEVLPAVPTEQ